MGFATAFSDDENREEHIFTFLFDLNPLDGCPADMLFRPTKVLQVFNP